MSVDTYFDALFTKLCDGSVDIRERDTTVCFRRVSRCIRPRDFRLDGNLRLRDLALHFGL